MCKEVSEEQFVKAEETVHCASDHTVEPGMHLEPCERHSALQAVPAATVAWAKALYSFKRKLMHHVAERL